MRLRVGLTGGIGSGKTAVGKRFAERGALLIDADALAREAVAPGSDALREIIGCWPAVSGPDGGLNRAALAEVVFNDAQALAALNAIVHPVVRRLGAHLEATAGPDQIVVHEVPLLFETGFDRTCDATVLVTASPQERIARAMRRSGLPRDDVERRMGAQIEPAAVRGRATFTIDNDGTLQALYAAADGVWAELTALPPRGVGSPDPKPPAATGI